MTDAPNPKHISQLKPTDRARADEMMRMALLAIVAGQAKPISMPTAHLDEIWESHRLVIETDPENGALILRAEKVGPLIITANSLPA